MGTLTELRELPGELKSALAYGGGSMDKATRITFPVPLTYLSCHHLNDF